LSLLHLLSLLAQFSRALLTTLPLSIRRPDVKSELSSVQASRRGGDLFWPSGKKLTASSLDLLSFFSFTPLLFSDACLSNYEVKTSVDPALSIYIFHNLFVSSFRHSFLSVMRLLSLGRNFLASVSRLVRVRTFSSFLLIFLHCLFFFFFFFPPPQARRPYLLKNLRLAPVGSFSCGFPLMGSS